MGDHSSTSISILSDDLTRSRRLAALLGQRFYVETFPLESFDYAANSHAACVIDANLSDSKTVYRIRECFSGASECPPDRYFVVDSERLTDMAQANALGARGVLRKCHIEKDAAELTNRMNERLLLNIWQNESDKTRRTLTGIDKMNDVLYAVVATNSPLPREQITDTRDDLIENIQEECLSLWLTAVKQHHSYTYRHSMIVSGLAVRFAQSLGMRRSDIERIAVGAMLHDLGKMRLPLSLLDKPGALTASDRAEINKHPGFGAEILQSDGQFDDEVMDIALHHHELLDGSGYPDGLKGDQISDLVRIVTVVDIFSALVDERAYKAAIPCERAYEMLVEMDGKLDRDIVRVFEKTALDADIATEKFVTNAAAI